MLTLQPDQLRALVALMVAMSLLGGFAGALMYRMLEGIAASAWELVAATEWYQDWSDREYVRWLNSDTGRKVRAARANRNGGFVSLLVVVAMPVIIATVSMLAGCTGGPAYLWTDREALAHERWVEAVKRSQW